MIQNNNILKNITNSTNIPNKSNKIITPKSKFQENKIIDFINSDILVTNIIRPFSIKLMQIDLFHINNLHSNIEKHNPKSSTNSNLNIKLKVNFYLL